MEYIKSFFKIVFTPLWWKEFEDSEIDEDENSSQNELGQFDIVEKEIEDEKYQFVFKKEYDVCVEELEHFLNSTQYLTTMEILRNSPNDDEEEMFLIDELFVD